MQTQPVINTQAQQAQQVRQFVLTHYDPNDVTISENEVTITVQHMLDKRIGNQNLQPVTGLAVYLKDEIFCIVTKTEEIAVSPMWAAAGGAATIYIVIDFETYC